jgi:hypothetical protein
VASNPGILGPKSTKENEKCDWLVAACNFNLPIQLAVSEL